MKSLIACENLDFSWTNAEVETFLELWKIGKDPTQIAKVLKRSVYEVQVLSIDQQMKGTIKREFKQERPKGRFPKKRSIDTKKFRDMYLDSTFSMSEIARKFNISRRFCYMIIERERSKDPDRWPVIVREFKGR